MDVLRSPTCRDITSGVCTMKSTDTTENPPPTADLICGLLQRPVPPSSGNDLLIFERSL